MEDIIFDYESDSEIKIIHRIDKSNMFLKKMYIYNAISTNPMQKYQIYVRKSKIISYSSKGKLTIVLAAIPSTASLIKFSNSLGDTIKAILDGTNMKISHINNRISDGTGLIPTMELSVDDDIVIYDNNMNELDELESLSDINMCDLFLELDNIQISNNVVSFIWKVLTLRELNKNINTRAYFEMIDEKNKPKIKLEMFSQPLVGEQMRNPKPKQSANKSPFMPNAMDLANAIKSLKKIDDEDYSKPDAVPVVKQQPQLTQTAFPITSSIGGFTLKKVSTKEPLNVMELMKNEISNNKLEINIVPIHLKAKSMDIMIRKINAKYEENKILLDKLKISSKEIKKLLKSTKNT